MFAWFLISSNFAFALWSLHLHDWKWALISGGVGAFALVTEIITTK